MIGNYSASNGEKHFQGEENNIRFEIFCPNCKAKGKDLKHKNWYMSKECGENLIIECQKCGYEINTETEDKSKCCKNIK